MAGSTADAAPRARGSGVLAVADLHKRYGAVAALRGAEFTVRAGSVHALLGANGSGKSTLLGILSGQTVPDRGSVLVDGVRLPPGQPRAAARAGIAVVTQETTLVPGLSVAENVLLGPVKPRGRFGIDWRATHEQAAATLGALGVELDTRRPVAELRPGERQLVEIARAVRRSRRVLVLDEATSSLGRRDTAGLMSAVRTLRADGVAVLLVSHRLDEVFAVADHLTVLRAGRTVADEAVARSSPAAVLEAMSGGGRVRRPAASAARSTRASLEVRGLAARRGPGAVDLSVAAGEIVGLAGLTGSGRIELLEALFGLRGPSAGTIVLGGLPFRPRSPRDAVAAGVAYVPAERRASGLVMTMSVEDNLAMVSTLARRRWSRARRRDAGARIAEQVRSDELAVPSLKVPVGTLSGGNQQKVLMAKWLAMDPRLLLLDEPTRGVDLASRGDVHALLRRTAGAGVAIVISAAESSELLPVCDRIAVLVDGTVREILPAAETTAAEIAALAAGSG